MVKGDEEASFSKNDCTSILISSFLVTIVPAASLNQFFTRVSVDSQLERFCLFSRNSLCATPLLVGIRRSRHNNLQWHFTIMEGLTPHPAVVTSASSEHERGLRNLAHYIYAERRLNMRHLCSKHFCLSFPCQRSLHWCYGVARLHCRRDRENSSSWRPSISKPKRTTTRRTRLVVPFHDLLGAPYGFGAFGARLMRFIATAT